MFPPFETWLYQKPKKTLEEGLTDLMQHHKENNTLVYKTTNNLEQTCLRELHNLLKKEYYMEKRNAS